MEIRIIGNSITTSGKTTLVLFLLIEPSKVRRRRNLVKRRRMEKEGVNG
jgi:hypothetical protein